MTVNAAAGARLYIGTTQDADVQADYELDSYIEVGEIEDLGEFGDESERITFASLADSRTRKFKGTRDAGDMTLIVGDDPTDEGQSALIAAEATKFDYNFKLVLNDALTLGGSGSVNYFRGKVFSKRRNIGSVNNIVRRNFTVAVNSAIIEIDPT